MKVGVESILFRTLTNSNAEAFLGGNRGEYDLRYGKLSEITNFTAGLAEEDPTALGGWTKHLPIEPFEGTDPVAAKQLRLRYMGPDGKRSDDTYIASQSSDPYPLWKPDRARPGASVAADLVGDVALVIKDTNGKYHARWVRREDIPTLPGALQARLASSEKGVLTMTSTSGAPSPMVADLIAALRRHHNVLLYGPPGTGKTHLVSEVRRHFSGGGVTVDTEKETGALTETVGGAAVYDAWATFHQSYSYEDFVVGLRPRPIDGGGFELEPRPGILLELSEWARQPQHESLLIIDEINRGNVSRIFGEFITLMEADKRLDDTNSATDQTVEVRLPFVDEGSKVTVTFADGSTSPPVPVPFTMPRRVFTLATMNSVDKSVAPLDAALRRRFHVVNIAPRLDEFRSHLGLDGRPLAHDLFPAVPASLDDARWLGVGLLHVLNERITLFLGPDYQFGEWFLAPLVDAPTPAEALAALADVWRTKLMPQLEEYFVGRSDQLIATLGEPKSDPALVLDEPNSKYLELGAVASVRANPAASDDQLLAFMATVVRKEYPAPAAPAAGSGDDDA